MTISSSIEEYNGIPIVVIDGKLADSDLKAFGDLLYHPFRDGCGGGIVDLLQVQEIGFVLLSAVYKINDELTAKGADFVVLRKQGELREEPPWGATYQYPLVVRKARDEAVSYLEQRNHDHQAVLEQFDKSSGLTVKLGEENVQAKFVKAAFSSLVVSVQHDLDEFSIGEKLHCICSSLEFDTEVRRIVEPDKDSESCLLLAPPTALVHQGETKNVAPEEISNEPIKRKVGLVKKTKTVPIKAPLDAEMGDIAVFGGGAIAKPRAKAARVVPLGKGGTLPAGSNLESPDLVTIFARSFTLYAENALPVIGTSAAMHLPLFLAIIGLVGLVLISPKVIFVIPFVIGAIQVTVWSFFEAGIARVVANSQLGIQSTTSLVLIHSWNRLGTVIGAGLARYLSFVAFTVLAIAASVVTGMFVGKGIGALVLICIMAFAIWFLIATFFTADVASIENKGGFDAVNRSVDIIRGYYLHAFALVIVLGLVVGISSKGLELGVSFALKSLIPIFKGSKYMFTLFMLASAIITVGTSFMTSLLASPVMFLGKTQLYFKSRIEKDGLSSGTLSKELSQ